ncbi:TPA: phage Gp37/Gp68 family protein [Burkholderia stabilis]|nr:phage Gp37/Gp68 family protein [Burkholderia stabilis]HDR9589156.1 phage Gp37/Gp68 family protein [Burkholderia stabilis]HDR9649552.1 phage Gp37/Gp68 family protein [Burkholderia stabilis]HDR9653618.1 phage Gp37/Gp68 family protein [Burkholderia stabilis]HDR9656313.1 phage Gp37/Gp68 family protein [Burkholderia stabilis]
MAVDSKIEWTDATFNPWIGCTRVSPACDHCYAAVSTPARTLGVEWGPHAERRRTSPGNWRTPIRWNAQHDSFFAEHGRRRRVFCASLADVFDNAVNPYWRADLFDLIEQTPNLDWLLLTKRIGNVLPMIEDMAARRFDLECLHEPRLPDNVVLGATIVNRAEMLRDASKLKVAGARVTFWSVEPMLGNLGDIPPELLPDWVICGGESGHAARPMHPDWVLALRDQCTAAGVPFLFKQWGEWCPRGPESMGYPLVDGVPRVRLTDAGDNGRQLGARGDSDCWMNRAGKAASGRLLDGRTWDEFPAVGG